MPFVFSTFFFFVFVVFCCCVGGTHHTSRVELRVHVYRGVLCSGILFESRERTRTVLRSVTLPETHPVDVAVGRSFNASPNFG